jgi:hypothetical protein
MEDRTLQKSSNNSDDVYQVGFAARLLRMGEFKLFGDAYHARHGEKPSEELLEHFFNRYLLPKLSDFQFCRRCAKKVIPL